MKKKNRSQEGKEDLCSRLSKIQGQVKGIANMIEEERYCIDILNQIAAARGALNRVSLQIMEEHIGSCFVNALREKEGQEEEVIEELLDVFRRFL